MPDHCGHRSPLNYDRTRYATCRMPAAHTGDHREGEFYWTDRTMPCKSAERATPHRLTGEHIVRERFGDERTDFGGPAGDYHQMVDE